MKRKNALTTIILGKQHTELFKRCSYESFRRYCEKIGCDLVIFDRPLDPSQAARNRSASWQKCLLLDQPRLKGYDQVAWMDSDTIINAELAPSIFDEVDREEIGVTADALPDEYGNARDFARSYYAPFRESPDDGAIAVEKVIQGGVWVMSPAHHAQILRNTYRHALKAKGFGRPYEQPAFGLEVFRSGRYRWIDPRFNVLVLPALEQRYRQRLLATARHLRFLYLLALPRIYKHSYILHFAGTLNYMRPGTTLLRLCRCRV